MPPFSHDCRRLGERSASTSPATTNLFGSGYAGLGALEAMTAGEKREALGRIEWLIEQVKQRRLSYGKAAELAGVPKARFIQLMGERHVSSIDYDEEELAAEVRGAEEITGR